MSENPSQDQPAGDPLSQTGSEADIDALLAGAAELAAGLDAEVGGEPGPAAAIPDDTAASPGLVQPGDQAQSDPTVDAQLDEIDSLLDRACEELGPDKANAPTGEETPDAGGATESQTPQPDGETQHDQDAAAHQARTDASGLPEEFADLSDVGDLPNLDDLPDLDPSAPGAGEKSPPKPARTEAVAPADGQSSRLWALLHRAIDLLDLLDRPLARIGYEVRVVLGWAALATLFAALCICVFSILG
jgi:hypothetical protein